jgi:hypothetical protein
MSDWLKRLFGKEQEQEPVIVVSGLPRSGTSMMMKMLEDGGLPVLTDHIRVANEDNPQGYYEFERVKRLPEDTEWLDEAVGKVVKIITQLLIKLPDSHSYRVLVMRRSIPEILASQAKMLERRGEAGGEVDDAKMTALFEKHLVQVYAWMDKQPNVEYIEVSYNQTLADPIPTVERVRAFLGGDLDAVAMAQVVDPDLYRNRG